MGRHVVPRHRPDGYDALPSESLRFFPAFPLLGRAFAPVFAGRADIALVVIANVASLAMAVAVRRLVLFERGSTQLADRAVWMVVLFPGAFVLSWAYAEAIWMLAAVVVFWAIRSRRWGWRCWPGWLPAPVDHSGSCWCSRSWSS